MCTELLGENKVARRKNPQPVPTQVMRLLLLSPSIQERVLVGNTGLGIRAAMRAARETEWETQVARFARWASEV